MHAMLLPFTLRAAPSAQKQEEPLVTVALTVPERGECTLNKRNRYDDPGNSQHDATY